ncbi:MAG: thiazole synthase [Gammaproteobacteria bacterium]|nr:thiazole synthase [Gammaproteobacteria bacterium]NVK86966.1 thiazole synthase [Gammaproteobacteria bacterium]
MNIDSANPSHNKTVPWTLADRQFNSRLMIGTAQYPSLSIMQQAIAASDAEIVTVSLRRENPTELDGQAFWQTLKTLNKTLLPNTAGCHTAKEAITTAQMARELFATHWIKLEVIGNDLTLQPDPFALVEAAGELVAQGFEVFPYCTDDLILCERLQAVGCRILMPWAAPIGSGKGIINPYALSNLRAHFNELTLIIDAGIGKPSDAVKALEMGYDGILLNTAIAKAANPIEMASAFNFAVAAGALGAKAGLIAEQAHAVASTPVVGQPFWHQV